MIGRLQRCRQQRKQNHPGVLQDQGIKFQREANGILKIPKSNGETIYFNTETGIWRTVQGVRGRGMTQLKEYLNTPAVGVPAWEIKLFRELFTKIYNDPIY